MLAPGGVEEASTQNATSPNPVRLTPQNGEQSTQDQKDQERRIRSLSTKVVTDRSPRRKCTKMLEEVLT